MNQYETVTTEVVNRVATITLNRPQALNSFNQALRRDLLAALEEAESDDEVRIIVLTGAGRAFCAGADLTEDAQALYPSFVEQCEAEYKPFLMAVADSDKLVIASVRGAAAGIGSAVMMNCDLVIMSDDAYLYQAFSAIGLMPDGGATQLLLHRVGYHRALEMAVDAGRLSAAECLELGLANKVSPGDALASDTQAWAEHLAQGAPIAQKYAKQMMRKARGMSYSEAVDEEAVLQTKCIATEDARIGGEAFLNKTKPVFTGR